MFSNGAGRSYGGGVVHIVSQEPQSNARHPQNPQIFKHEKCEQICFTQKSATTTVEAKSLVPFTAESRNLKSRQTCNRTSAPLDKSTKNVHFCNTCACCCCLSKKKFFLLSAIPLQSEIRERLHKNLVSVLIQVFR